ncbi:HXXEE domain-containing protein [Actinosynnema sp. NPDC047251]|uniref:Putative membrane protein n=1 Tax=Saccharothrix espanaensis (strain ATCC 51144 / DSM 44229 / JCM 9112 / NBRC 15066 / NRRL 15764) TaxID=1179773 RepID=K0K7B4_SACES|nr:HXXEE domain-containing protein [Saccharothrix espanaensis]CCH34241.1 putative membrane protein [Saccharothrix espanaensis DSM 44229]
MVSKKVTWGLLAAWVVHDIEELVTMPGWTRRNRVVPTTSPAEATIAIGVVGAVIAAASAAGARTDGRSPFFQAVLTGFGVHSITHVLASAVFRGYTPGLITAPTVVAPFSLWAAHRLRRGGIRLDPSPRALIWFPITIGAAHGIAHLTTRVRDYTSRVREPAR